MLSKMFSDRMKILLGDEYDLFMETFNNEEEKAIRINTNKISVEKFLKISKFSLEPIPYTNDSFYIKDKNLGIHPYHHAGLFYVQDPAAMMPFNAVELKDDFIVLDLCAAPGGKTGQIASFLKNGILVANEINNVRVKSLYSNVERLGLTNTVVLNNDSYSLSKKFSKMFDAIFIDAPCSGEGMFRKNDKAIETWSEKKIEECSVIQKELLKNADKMLKDGGYLIYSTCTYSLEENELQITEFLKNYNYEVLEIVKKLKPFVKEGYVNKDINPELKKAARFYPHITRGEGQFVCVLKKKGTLNKTKLIFKTNHLIDKYIKDDIDINLDVESYEDKFYTKLPINISGLRIVSSGVKLGELRKNRFIYHHYFATAYGKYFKNNLNLKLDDDRVQKYLKGYEIEDDSVKDGYGVILVDGYPLGLFKASSGKLKNHYPQGLRNRD